MPGSVAGLVWEELLGSLGSCPHQSTIEPGLANRPQSREVTWTVCGVGAMGPASASMTTAPHGHPALGASTTTVKNGDWGAPGRRSR